MQKTFIGYNEKNQKNVDKEWRKYKRMNLMSANVQRRNLNLLNRNVDI